MKDAGTRVAVVFRTLPEEKDSALVVSTDNLPSLYHDAFIDLIDSAEGQESNELQTVLNRRQFPDGTNMLAMLHNDNYLKKFSTKDVIVTYGNTTDGRIALNKLNEQIARDMGIKVSELAVKDDSPKAEAQPKKADAKKTTAKK